jgi:hypothetical protein
MNFASSEAVPHWSESDWDLCDYHSSHASFDGWHSPVLECKLCRQNLQAVNRFDSLRTTLVVAKHAPPEHCTTPPATRHALCGQGVLVASPTQLSPFLSLSLSLPLLVCPPTTSALRRLFKDDRMGRRRRRRRDRLRPWAPPPCEPARLWTSLAESLLEPALEVDRGPAAGILSSRCNSV